MKYAKKNKHILRSLIQKLNDNCKLKYKQIKISFLYYFVYKFQALKQKLFNFEIKTMEFK